MSAEILAIGNEVVDGSVVNTNASWLSQQLSLEGIEVRRHTSIPDDEAMILKALEKAGSRAQWVLVTGGLGPTVDDFTLENAARFFAKPLVEDAASLDRIRDFFRRLGRELTPNQEKQALIPQGSIVLLNQLGTAPGVYLEHHGVHFAFFPGVPQEMKRMYEASFLPILKKNLGGEKQGVLKVLRCFGLPEGQLDDMLKDKLQGRLGLGGAQLGFRVRFPTIDVRLGARDADAAKARSLVEAAELTVRACLGDFIFGEADQSLEEVVGGLLRSKAKTLATAESCTGGLLASLITDVAGASEYFLEGVVSYSNPSKMDLLGVKAATLKTDGAVSAQTALEMARGIRDRAKADFGVGITGIAGPSGGSEGKPAGTVHISIVHPGGEWEHGYLFPFGRARFKQLAAATALDRLRRILTTP